MSIVYKILQRMSMEEEGGGVTERFTRERHNLTHNGKVKHP